jgi:hypothetical protein
VNQRIRDEGTTECHGRLALSRVDGRGVVVRREEDHRWPGGFPARQGLEGRCCCSSPTHCVGMSFVAKRITIGRSVLRRGGGLRRRDMSTCDPHDVGRIFGLPPAACLFALTLASYGSNVSAWVEESEGRRDGGTEGWRDTGGEGFFTAPPGRPSVAAGAAARPLCGPTRNPWKVDRPDPLFAPAGRRRGRLDAANPNRLRGGSFLLKAA